MMQVEGKEQDLSNDVMRSLATSAGGLRTQQLVFIAARSDDSGGFVTGKELNVRFALKESTYARLTETGLEMSVTLQAPAEADRLRGVAQGGIDSKSAASTLPVQMR